VIGGDEIITEIRPHFRAECRFKRFLVIRFRVRPGASAVAAYLVAASSLFGIIMIALSPTWMNYLFLSRFVLDARPALFSLCGLILALAAAVLPTGSTAGRLDPLDVCGRAILAGAGFSILLGGLMILKLEAWPGLTRLAYTGFDAVVLATLVLAAFRVVLRIADSGPANRSSLSPSDLR
jgi:hypothetical protein